MFSKSSKVLDTVLILLVTGTLGLALCGIANAQLGGNEDVLTEGDMLQVIWLDNQPYGALSLFNCPVSSHDRCYLRSYETGTVCGYEKIDGNWYPMGCRAEGEYENPMDTSCSNDGITNVCSIFDHYWMGFQHSTMRPWTSGFGGCATTIWGCNPFN